MIFITDEQYEIADSNGISKHIVYTRVFQHGWDIEKAIVVPVTPRAYRARKHPKKYTDMAIANGISLCTFYTRLKKGWGYEKASTIKPIPRAKRNKKKVV